MKASKIIRYETYQIWCD